MFGIEDDFPVTIASRGFMVIKQQYNELMMDRKQPKTLLPIYGADSNKVYHIVNYKQQRAASLFDLNPIHANSILFTELLPFMAIIPISTSTSGNPFSYPRDIQLRYLKELTDYTTDIQQRTHYTTDIQQRTLIDPHYINQPQQQINRSDIQQISAVNIPTSMAVARRQMQDDDDDDIEAI